MKLIIKIAILTGLIAFVSSCQKENIPSPAAQGTTSGQRLSNGSGSTNSGSVILKDGEKSTGTGEIVGGGDDDRDGGNGKQINTSNTTQSDSTQSYLQGEGQKGPDDIVGGGDDDRDGGAGGKKGG